MSRIRLGRTYIIALSTKRHVVVVLDRELIEAVCIEWVEMWTPIHIFDLVWQCEELLLNLVELLSFCDDGLTKLRTQEIKVKEPEILTCSKESSRFLFVASFQIFELDRQERRGLDVVRERWEQVM